MAVNKDAKKITSLARTALKAAGHEQRAWFAVGVGKDYFFYIDKKLKDPKRFKEPLAIKKILTGLKIDKATEIKKDSLVVAGTIKAVADHYEMTVKVKSNGGGKSTLKSLVKDAGFKKIIGNVEIVKQHDGKVDEADAAMDAEIQEAVKGKGVSGVKTSKDNAGKDKVEIPDNIRTALKTFKWWDKEGRADYERLKSNATANDEDTLQTIQRRLTKYAKASLYKLFDGGFVWDGALKKIRPDNYDLTKDNLKSILKETKAALGKIQSAKSEGDFEDVATEVVDEVAAASKEYGELEAIGKKLKLKDDALLSFMDAGKGNLALVQDLTSRFSKDEVKMLLKYVGGGNWDRLLIQIMFM